MPSVPALRHRAIGAALAGLAAAALATAMLPAAALAGAPQVKTQAPGYYRMMLGDFEVTVLSDGTFPMDAGKLLARTTPEEVKKDLSRQFLGTPFDLSVNAFLVNTGSKLVLIDTGAGGMAPTVGKLRTHLAAAGYQPGQIDEIYITHMHGDHVGGLSADGKPLFPNATVRAAKQEADFWLSKDNMDKAPKEAKDTFQGAMDAIHPYVAAGRFKPFDGETELVPGVKAIPAPGHTPGHTVYAIESKGHRLLLWGDLMHVAAVQFPNPAVTIQFDTDQNQAAAARKKVFADAAEHADIVGGAHLSFPALGHLRASGTGYVFVPVNYDAIH